jgi:hypothetical protein
MEMERRVKGSEGGGEEVCEVEKGEKRERKKMGVDG